MPLSQPLKPARPSACCFFGDSPNSVVGSVCGVVFVRVRTVWDEMVVFITVQAPTAICTTRGVFLIPRVKRHVRGWVSFAPKSPAVVQDFKALVKSSSFIFHFVIYVEHVLPCCLVSHFLARLTITLVAFDFAVIPLIPCDTPSLTSHRKPGSL